MDTKTPAPKLNAAPPRHYAVWLVGLAVVGLLVFSVYFFSGPPPPQVTWLNPNEVVLIPQNKLWNQFKYKVTRFAAPLVHRWRSRQPQIHFALNILSLPPSAAGDLKLGDPFSTNASHLRAWMLSPTNYQIFDSALRTNSGMTFLAMPSIQINNGGSGQLQMTSPVKSGTNFIPAGTVVDLVAKAFGDSVRVATRVTLTEVSGNAADGTPIIQTNIAVACRATIPSGGALVLDSGNADKSGGKNYWVIVTPNLVDGFGKPYKP